VNHYEVLGVRPGAPADEIRRAYLTEARRHHPDLEADPDRRRDAERRMQRVNEAWAVLGHPDRRAAYDRRGGLPGVGEVPRRPWTPLEPDDPDEIDPRDLLDLLDDDPIGDGSRIPRALQLAPPLLIVAALMAIVIGSTTAIPGLLMVGLGAGVAAVLLFLAAPFFAVLRSSRSGMDASSHDE
jgi:curved DNA-binding protein CbpA